MKRGLAVAAIAGLLMGPTCGGEPSVSVWFSQPPPTTPIGSLVAVDVIINSSSEIQAWDIDAAADAGLVIWAVTPHPQFDDDGALFRNPSLDFLNRLALGAVDLRHGSPVTGQKRIATIEFWALQAGTHELRITRADLAGPDGARRTANTYPLQVTVAP